MMRVLNIIILITIAASTLYISFDQPQTITSNDAVIHCEIMAPTIRNGLNPYIHENLVQSDIRKEKRDSVSNTPFNHIPTLNTLLLILCNETQVNWLNLYPYFLLFTFSFVVLFISKIGAQPLHYSLFFLSLGNGVYQSIRNGNLSSFAFLFLVLSCYLVWKKKYFIGGILYSVYCLYRITPLIVIVLLLFFLSNERAKKFLKGFSSMFIPSVLFSGLFQTVLLKDWFLRVLLPEKVSNKFNESLSEGRQVLGENILGDYFDIPSVLNLIHFINKLSFTLAVVLSIFFIFSFYKLFLSLNRIEFNLDTLIVLNILHLSITPYFRSYHIIELSFIITIWLIRNHKEFPMEYWIFPVSLYIGTYIKSIDGDTLYVILFNDLSIPLLLFFFFTKVLYIEIKKKSQLG